MADAADSKSVGLKTVRVQVPPPARTLYLFLQVQGFLISWADYSPEKDEKSAL